MNITNTAEEMVRRVGSIPDDLTAGACFGAPVERDGHTLIPVARINFGLGMGFGGGSRDGVPSELSARQEFAAGEGGGGGGGGGGSATPVAVIDITSNEVRVQPVTDTTRIALGSYALAGWVTFWLFLTVRTIARERGKTGRKRLEAHGA